MPIEIIVSMKFCVGHKAMFCEQRNFCLVYVLLAGWLVGWLVDWLVGGSQSKTVCSS